MRFRRLPLAISVPVLAALALGACGGDQGPTIRADTGTSTTAALGSTTSSTAAATSDTQVVTFGALQLTVPASWPVHDLAAEPTTCVRVDEHAAYLGEQGDHPDCPARVVGHTETLWIAPLSDRHQVDAARATEATSINGIPAKIDPNPDANGALTAIFTDQHLLVIITFGDARPVADAILASATKG